MPFVEYEALGGQAVSISVERKLRYLGSLNGRMAKAMMLVHEYTRQWQESAGEGSWAKLAASTIKTKGYRGYSNPSRILYATGDLFESMTSTTGPHSWVMPMADGITFGVNWAPAHYLDAGVVGQFSIHGIHSHIPPRSLWPPVHTVVGREMQDQIRRLFLIDGEAHLLNFL